MKVRKCTKEVSPVETATIATLISSSHHVLHSSLVRCRSKSETIPPLQVPPPILQSPVVGLSDLPCTARKHNEVGHACRGPVMEVI